ncbi:MAG: bifunctional (p)ppGpp synthetase/guanosine-3',5'-bis(diphosphate) 3'-pyrophosphohydrolase [Kiritimatiellae bacterium]|nr:bifunctional (p)ppGpp synthetase/guanosine-3',5'-bis(diphosphate) 3'-pyrophosphohydrolase [Kiritimatiellia bacterium]
MFEDIENNSYFINEEVGIAFALTEYGWCGYDPEWGEFSASIPLELEARLFNKGGGCKAGSRRVDYNEALDYAIAKCRKGGLMKDEQAKGETMPETEAIRQMEELAHRRHEGQFRDPPDGRPYIVHPQAVYEMLKGWGYNEVNDVVTLCVAWGHDLVEDAEPKTDENRAAIAREIVKAGGQWGDEILAGIRQLSLIIPDGLPDDEYDKLKKEYMEGVAANAPLAILAVKMADRLCNTLDFAKASKSKAKRYLEKGRCLFNRLGEMPRPEPIRNALARVESAVAGD